MLPKIIWKYLNKLTLANSFEAGLKPVIILMTLSGVTPFKYDFSKNPKAFLYPPLVVYAIGLSGVYFTCCVMVLTREESLLEFFDTSQVLTFSDKIRTLLGLVCIFLAAVETLLFINRYAINIRNHIKVDQAMVNLGIIKDYKVLFWQSFAVVSASLLFNAIFVVLISLTWSKTPSLETLIALYIPEYLTEISLLLYGYGTFLVLKDIELINKQLAMLCNKTFLRGMDLRCMIGCEDLVGVRDPNKEIKTRALVQRINMIRKVYDRICDVAESVHEAFSFKVLAFVTMCFMSIVFNLFYVISVVTSFYWNGYSDILIPVLYYSLHQTLTHTLFVGILAITCEHCKLKTDETEIFVSKLLMQEQSEDVSQELFRFSAYILHRRPTFNVVKMFNIDNTLIFTIIGATTTYLIILVQFSVALWENTKTLNEVLNTTDIIQ